MNFPVENWKAEIVGYTAPEGAMGLQKVVPLDADECVQAQFCSYKGHVVSSESADATKLVLADADTMAIITKLSTRLAHDAFEAGVRWQQQRTAQVLGVALAPEGD